MKRRMAEMRGGVRDYVRLRNIKRATLMEFWQLITPLSREVQLPSGEGALERV
jgi:hypothetical protein